MIIGGHPGLLKKIFRPENIILRRQRWQSLLQEKTENIQEYSKNKSFLKILKAVLDSAKQNSNNIADYSVKRVELIKNGNREEDLQKLVKADILFYDPEFNVFMPAEPIYLYLIKQLGKEWEN